MNSSYIIVHGKKYFFVEIPPVIVTFDATGGTLTTGEGSMIIQCGPGTEVGSIPSNPSKENYRFSGWFTAAKGGTKVTANTIVEKDTTFYAQWIPSQFTITYNLNGGQLPAGSSNPESYNSDTPSFTLVQPQKNGYTFSGWSGTDLAGTPLRVTVQRGSSGNRLYTANWNANSYVISYNMNGHGVIPDDALRTYTIETATYSPPDPEPVEGWTFTGWTPANIQQGSTGNVEFSANWQVKTHTATFDANGGEGGLVKTLDYGTPLSAPTVTKTGHVFV